MTKTYIYHSGTKGMKWGRRRYQNSDGSLTAEGRIHYGVGQARKSIGKAAHGVKEAIRKKVAPTNAELNAQIRKEKSKLLNKQKKEQLRDLKRGIDTDAKKERTGKRFYELSDADIDKRIERLKKEAQLVDLEATKNMGPAMRMVHDAVLQGGKQGISEITKNYMTKMGNQFIDKAAEDYKKKLNGGEKEKSDDDKLKEAADRAQKYKTIADAEKAWRDTFGSSTGQGASAPSSSVSSKSVAKKVSSAVSSSVSKARKQAKIRATHRRIDKIHKQTLKEEERARKRADARWRRNMDRQIREESGK